MALNELTVKEVEALREPGMHADGGGLWLIITKAGSKRWMFKYQLAGNRREMGLGPANKGGVSLGDARDARDAAKKLIRDGVDPVDQRRKEAVPVKAVPFFQDFALVVGVGLDMRREASRTAWLAAVAPKHTGPLTGVPVNEITTDHVKAVLGPIWKTLPVKAKKLRQKIELILSVARVEGHMGPLDVPYQNPAMWDGHLKLMMPKRKHKVTHYKALPYDEIGGFMAELQMVKGVPARALELMILTVPRGHEVRHMLVENLDLDHRLWRVPDVDQKSNREYLVPLADRPLAILQEALAALGPNPDPKALVFPCRIPGSGYGKRLSHNAFLRVVHAMGYKGRATPHGMRSAFRDWAGDCTTHTREVIELCLSHIGLGDEAELAYRRSDALEKRKLVLDDWAIRCADVSADKVVAFKPKAVAA